MNDKLAEAIKSVLNASGLDPNHEDLRDTPTRVAQLWENEFLAGYRMNPEQILSATIEQHASPDAIFIKGISFHSMCPHHLLPFRGQAHVAYIPDGKVLGFGTIAKLVDCFTLRLTLQERATTQIAQTLFDYLPARGTGCVLEAEHLCLAIPGDRHNSSRTFSCAFYGEFKERADLRNRLMAAVG